MPRQDDTTRTKQLLNLQTDAAWRCFCREQGFVDELRSGILNSDGCTIQDASPNNCAWYLAWSQLLRDMYPFLNIRHDYPGVSNRDCDQLFEHFKVFDYILYQTQKTILERFVANNDCTDATVVDSMLNSLTDLYIERMQEEPLMERSDFDQYRQKVDEDMRDSIELIRTQSDHPLPLQGYYACDNKQILEQRYSQWWFNLLSGPVSPNLFQEDEANNVTNTPG